MVFNEIPKQLDFPKIEHQILKFWETHNIFARYKIRNKGRPRWSFQDGPITANGPMGVHHAWGRAYKDIFQRYKTMKGFEQRYQNGFDCQGLWVEVGIERELSFKSKKDIEKYGVDKFVERCKESVHKYSMLQTEQSIRLGMWMDWGDWKTSLDDKNWLMKSHSYYTMSDVNNYTIWYFLKKCHERGFIYKGVDVMPWCARCGTAISDMEIATEGYKELTHKAVTVRFKITGKDNEYILVWTTTPWTLTSNTGVAVHPELVYVKVKNDDAFYYLAKSLVKVLKGKYEIVKELPGKELLGLTYEGPFDYLDAQKDVIHKVIPWEEVSQSEGTGLVHIAPGCGKEDFALGKKYDLKTVAPLDELGIYLGGFAWLTGKDVKEVAGAIIEDLKKRQILYHVEDYSHRYPVCWRCDSELVFRLVDEWFISMDTLRNEIAEVTKKVERWIPEFGLDRELDWLRNMSDWCISRKRYWGLALPIWQCKCGHFTIIGSKDELQKKTVDGWDEFDGHSPHRPWVDRIKIKCEKCGSLVSRVPDVGSPWLDAGIVPFSTIRSLDDMHNLRNGYPYDKLYWEKWFPADFITESFPGQFRNWFYAILTTSTVLEKRPPFKVLLGFASMRDEHGEEMHKSKGNAIIFDEAAEKTGADVMRWMFAKHNIVQNLNFGYGPAAETKRILLTPWNVYAFFMTYANIDRFNPIGKSIVEKNLTKLDRWILSRLNSWILNCEAAYDSYELVSLVKQTEEFFDDLSNWYVRRNRRRFWKSENDTDKETAYLVLYECLVKMIKIIAPIMPFLTEEVYRNLIVAVAPEAPESIHLCNFPDVDKNRINANLENEVALTRTIVSLGRAARNSVNIKIRQPLVEMIITLDHGALSLEDQEIIKEELNIKVLKLVDAKALNQMIVLKALPNFTKLGPKFTKTLNKAVEWIKAMDQHEIQSLLKIGFLKKEVDGELFEVTKEDVEIKKIEKTGWCVITEDNLGVAINTTITKELANEGLVRELIHKIQLMRKEADFNLVDRIKIFYQTNDALKEAIIKNLDYLKHETLAIDVVEGIKIADITNVIDINGIETKIALQKIKSL